MTQVVEEYERSREYSSRTMLSLNRLEEKNSQDNSNNQDNDSSDNGVDNSDNDMDIRASDAVVTTEG